MQNRISHEEELSSLSGLGSPSRDGYVIDPTIERIVATLAPVNQSALLQGELKLRLSSLIHLERRPLRVGIFDGAFDPPHRGHEETARAAIGIGNLDLLVVTCYPLAPTWKPDLSPHHLRVKMTSSYFLEDSHSVVTPLPSAALEELFRNHLTVGVIGSDTFNRFLQLGISRHFNAQSIFVTERRNAPLASAPVTLEGRPVLYVGATQLAFNTSSSSHIRETLAGGAHPPASTMLNESAVRILRTEGLYLRPRSIRTPFLESSPVPAQELPLPERYMSCSLEPHQGLMNGLLSDSALHRVRTVSGKTVAFRKSLPPHRDPETNLSDELLGLQSFNTLHIPNARAPFGELSRDPLALWIESAPGETIADLLIGFERGEQNIEDTCGVLRSVGTMLRNLHDAAPLPYSPDATKLLTAYINETRALIAQASQWQLDEPQCRKAITDFRESADVLVRTGLRCGLIHGDANCGNFLWDSLERTMWVIDLQRFGTQLRTASPGFPTFDLHNLLSALDYYPNIGFRGKQGSPGRLVGALYEGYGELPQQEDRFFRARRIIQKLLGRHLRGEPPHLTTAGPIR
ncbi:MAG: Cytidylyltransferase-like [Pseudomonadota bacterium]